MRFIVSGQSMEPTFKPGQTLLVSSIPYLFRQPKIGDVVVVKDPRDPTSLKLRGASGRLLLKRITKISSRYSGEERRDDSRIRFWTGQNDKEYFVEGDNPKESTDSRMFGSITRKTIVGKMLLRT